ncbi:magnesium transporter [Reichenbachiella faecimaris]|uniref:Magnesium transport protein CorA n=1 Tax=Reichenbachiella faecimaris TaxID=692418 RepID=A0A1W2GQA0_REIFA|nr:magnesium/cobalt transporter CorA [Reichenbachiella faecimaris]SMD38819.1 magnesium transporter [Reichenbachiella faecimaris]
MLTLIQYNKSTHQKEEKITPQAAFDTIEGTRRISWLDIESHDRNILQEVISLNRFHPLTLEDILIVESLPKFEVFDDYIFFSANMLTVDTNDLIAEEKISIVLKKNVLITFQEGLPGDVFDELRNKIKRSLGIIRANPVDYLFYQVLNAIVSSYSHIAEKLRFEIEELEDQILTDDNYEVMKEVIAIKRKVNLIRRHTIPLLDAVTSMKTEGAQFLRKANQAYLHDLQDQVKNILAFCNTSREMLRDIMDLHHTNQNNEMNRVMKTLTIVSAIFIPMTFIAGIYGMNFHTMPELDWKYGYFGVLGAMGVIGAIIFYILKRKQWL